MVGSEFWPAVSLPPSTFISVALGGLKPRLRRPGEGEGDGEMLTGLSGTMCLPTGRPMPERSRREEATERPTTPFPPMIFDATLLNLPAILSIFFFFLFFFAVSAAICFVVFAGFYPYRNTTRTPPWQ